MSQMKKSTDIEKEMEKIEQEHINIERHDKLACEDADRAIDDIDKADISVDALFIVKHSCVFNDPSSPDHFACAYSRAEGKLHIPLEVSLLFEVKKRIKDNGKLIYYILQGQCGECGEYSKGVENDLKVIEHAKKKNIDCIIVTEKKSYNQYKALPEYVLDIFSKVVLPYREIVLIEDEYKPDGINEFTYVDSETIFTELKKFDDNGGFEDELNAAKDMCEMTPYSFIYSGERTNVIFRYGDKREKNKQLEIL